MFSKIFQRQKNEVKECGLKTGDEVRTSNFLAGGGGAISSYASAGTSRLNLMREGGKLISHGTGL